MDPLQAKAKPKEGGIASARGGLPARGESCSACTGQNKEIAQEGVLHAGKVLCFNLTSGLHVSCSEESLALLQQSFTEMFLGVCTSNGHDMHLKSNACHVHGMFFCADTGMEPSEDEYPAGQRGLKKPQHGSNQDLHISTRSAPGRAGARAGNIRWQARCARHHQSAPRGVPGQPWPP